MTTASWLIFLFIILFLAVPVRGFLRRKMKINTGCSEHSFGYKSCNHQGNLADADLTVSGKKLMTASGTNTSL